MPSSDSPSAGSSLSSSEKTQPGIAASAARSLRRAHVPAPRWFVWLGFLALAGYALFLGSHMTAVAGGADSSGYMNSAKLFAAGQLRTDVRVPPEFSGLEFKRVHFVPAGLDLFPGSPRLVPTYPTGFPLHLALAARLLGWEIGPFAMQLFLAVAAVWLCYATARELGLHYALAAAGAALLAVFPVFIFASFQTLSDTPATTWTLAAMYAALRGRRHAGWAAACGAALAVAVLVRPTNALLAPALVVLLGFDLRRLACFVAGGLPGALWFGFYNHTLYGAATRTGYIDISEAFAWKYVVPTIAHFAKWLAYFLPPVVLALPFVALARRDTRHRELLGLGLLACTIIGFYLFCAYSHDSWPYLRYILPAIPALILAALLGLEALARAASPGWSRAFRPAAAVVLVLWAGFLSWRGGRAETLYYVPGYERAYLDAAKLVRAHAPDHALMVSCNTSGAIYFYTGMPTLIFDSVEPEDFARYRTLAQQAGRPIYAALFDIEQEDAFRRCPGNWTKLGSAGSIGLWKLQ